MKTKFNILFLQGPTSSFWRELGASLRSRGHGVFKINVHFGDALYWRSFKSSNYFGPLEEWEDYLDAYVRRNKITHVIYYADRVPYHVVAARVAKARGVRAIAIENGYLRPDWLTFEIDGMAAHSHFPEDPETILAVGSKLPEPDLEVKYSHKFGAEAFHEVSYNLSRYFFRLFFPRYHADRYYDPLVDYVSFLPRLFRSKKEDRKADAVVAQVMQGDDPFFVFTLQLQSDYQIRVNSPYGHMSEMIEEVVSSFVAHAAPNARLVFKLHPHDNGLENWPKVVRATARRYGAEDRVVLIDGGDLNAMLGKAKGCLMVNSTAGLHALRAGCPTKVLGIAVFDIPGLTHRGDLKSFWQTPQPVDAALLDAFLRALAGSIQVKGSFYDPAGRRVAIDEIVGRLESDRVNQPGCFVDPPPRLARARIMGLPCAAPEPVRVDGEAEGELQTAPSIVSTARM